MRYLRGTTNYDIEYNRFAAILKGYNNANRISDSNETKFTSGYVFTRGSGAVAWRSSRQTIIVK